MSVSMSDIICDLPLAYERSPIPRAAYKALEAALRRWHAETQTRPWILRYLTPPAEGWCIEILILRKGKIEVVDVDETHGEPGFYVLQTQIGENTPWVEIARVEGNEP